MLLDIPKIVESDRGIFQKLVQSKFGFYRQQTCVILRCCALSLLELLFAQRG
jgi:hypothetical protein